MGDIARRGKTVACHGSAGRHHLGTRLGRVNERSGTSSGCFVKVTAWPAWHFSGRGLADSFTTLWSSFVFEGGPYRVDYGADSGWWEGITEFAAHYDALAIVNRNLDRKTQVA